MRRGTLAAPLAEASGSAPGSWRAQLARAIRDPQVLLRRLGLPERADLPQDFPLVVPDAFVARMRVGDAQDPLLLQVLPTHAEAAPQPPGYSADPLAEADQQPVPGLLHKYRDRVLLISTGACAVHCRYCFRRHFPYQALRRATGWWRAALSYIAAHPEVHELILSGGDPLTLPDAQLAELASEAAGIPHLRRLRLHSRLPVVLPSRVDQALLTWLGAWRGERTLVIHANHAHELDDSVAQACAALRHAGVRVLNQAVLLRGINDNGQTLVDLCRRLGEIGVGFYYLHQLDAVAGGAHFAVSDNAAAALMRSLHAELAGYLLPRLVREEPGKPGKTPLAW